MRKADQTAWDVLSSASKQKQNNNTQSQLDKVIKSTPDSNPSNSAAQELEAIARGNFSLSKGMGGSKSSTGAIVDGSKVAKGMNLGGSGVTGSFMPDGSSAQKATDLVKLASPLFTVGASDVGATVDVYGGVLNSPQNRVQSILGDVLGIVNTGLSGILGKELSKIGSSLNIVSNITNEKTAMGILDQFRSGVLSGVPLTKDSMQKTLFNSIGYTGKSLNFLDGIQGTGKSILKDIVNNIDGNTGLLTLYKDTELLLKGDFSNAEGIFKIVDNITSNTKLGSFLDLSNQLKIINTVTKSLYNLGVPKLFDDIYEKLSSTDKVRYVKDNLPDALDSGDLDFIELALKNHGGAWVLSVYPNAINIIVSSYTPKRDLDGNISREEYDRLISVLNQIDNRWCYVGESGRVGDLNIFSNFNNHSRSAFVAGGDRWMISNMLLSEKYGQVYNTLDEVQKRYKNYPIK